MVCCVEGCGAKLGNRNKHGYCKIHTTISPQFKLKRSKAQAKFYAKLSSEEKHVRKQRTQACKDSKLSKERLEYLNKIRQLSDSEKESFFKKKRRNYNAAREKQRKQKDVGFRISKNLRSRLSKIISLEIEAGSSIKDLGCSLQELKQYLESKFKPGMTWDNYGHKGWHIDHIRPLCSFNLTDLNQLRQACHYTNLQPLWWRDNLSKISKDKEIKNGKQVDEENSR